MKIYLASPYGFTEATTAFLDELESRLMKQGHQVFNPWLKKNAPRAWVQIARNNEKALRACDAVLACLDGPDVDSGVASEVGFARAIGKRIYGYRSDIRRSGDHKSCVVNLQLQYWIMQSGGRIFGKLDEVVIPETVE